MGKRFPAFLRNSFVAERPLAIVQVNTADRGDGADRVAWNLFQAYRERGHHSFFAVGYKRTEDPSVFLLPNHFPSNPWTWFLNRVSLRLGHENFDFPDTWKLLDIFPKRPDIVHCHNLHGGYFDLRALARISREVPVVFTLHDAWPLSGHCAHSFDCDRWKTGCGACPDLTIYPSARRDATAFNWRRKRKIFSKSRLYVSTPCRWLMQKVEQSILAPAVVESRVIPHGVDLSVFHPADKEAQRAKLGIPLEVKLFIFAAKGILKNQWKCYTMMREAVGRVSERREGERLWFLALGEDRSMEKVGRAIIRFIPYQKDPAVVACYYQAADVYLHAARAETFPNVVSEALACGTPIVATAVGGIVEQVKSLKQGAGDGEWKTYGADEATGILVPPRDVGAMADSLERLLSDENLRQRLGDNAARDASERFNLEQQVNSYLDWYQEILF